MKKIIITILSFIVLVLCTNAQVTMRVEMKDGKQIDFPILNVKHVTWMSNEDNSEIPEMSPPEVQAVDLGLPSRIRWANMNIGAESPEDCGYYFAWGEITGNNGGNKTFSEDAYKYYLTTKKEDEDGFVITTSGYTKYVTKSDASSYGYNGFYDEKTVLSLDDDAATAKWGGSWRLPTKAEQDELRNNCTWGWTEMKGVKGYKVTGPNGSYIFLPAAGLCGRGGLMFADSQGAYWSSSLGPFGSGGAYSIHFGSDDWNWSVNPRSFGCSVRAVCP